MHVGTVLPADNDPGTASTAMKRELFVRFGPTEAPPTNSTIRQYNKTSNRSLSIIAPRSHMVGTDEFII